MICFYCTKKEEQALGFCSICSRGICIAHSEEKEISFDPERYSNLLKEGEIATILVCGQCITNTEHVEIKSRIEYECAKCGNLCSDKFCSQCGSETRLKSPTTNSNRQSITCPNCNQGLDEDVDECPNCGENFDSFARDLLNTCVECGFSDDSLEFESECTKCGAILPI